jgi:outer membrane protein OmpA-like peptidoglycan-associated protein
MGTGCHKRPSGDVIVITKMTLATFVHRRAPRGIRRLPDGRHIASIPCLATCSWMLGEPSAGQESSMVFSNRRIGLLGVTVAIGLALSSGFASAAEQRSAEDIINALKPPRVTRGLTTSPPNAARAADETRFLAALRNRPTRSLSTEEREKISSIASSKPKIDLEINFEFNSAVIGSKAMPQVTELGKALTSEDLRGRTFILSGFTDAKGSETYNRGLSERRADAVKQFLSEKIWN